MLGEKELRDILNIGIEITTEKDKNHLLENMLDKAMEVAECDAGTLYLYESKDRVLKFRVMKTLSQNVNRGQNGEIIDIPPAPLKEENVCAYAAIHRELVNIEDVYNSNRFDFSGPKKYDKLTGYRTGSMLVIPLEDAEGILIGVLQLINKLDGDNFISFTEDDEFIIKSLGSMAAVSLSEMIYIEEVKEQMDSFARAFAAAVDERTPYNGTHTRKVTEYSRILAEHINKLHAEGKCGDYFDDNRKEQLVLAATLHDIGKMIVPLGVMNKATRLDKDLERVESRFSWLKLAYERDFLKGLITEKENNEMQEYLDTSIADVRRINTAGFISDDDVELISRMAGHIYERIEADGSVTGIHFLTDAERDKLSIRKGTLTSEERDIMQSHVVMTKKILDKVHFNSRYANVTKFASTHHELLDGSGYPNHISGDELELETRMLAVVDIFDALTCTDRPYKKPMPREKAFDILRINVKEGKLEGRLVDYLEDALKDIPQEEIDKRCAQW